MVHLSTHVQTYLPTFTRPLAHSCTLSLTYPLFRCYHIVHTVTPIYTSPYPATPIHNHQHPSTPTHSHLHPPIPIHTYPHLYTHIHIYPHLSTPIYTHPHPSTPTPINTHPHPSIPNRTYPHPSTSTQTHNTHLHLLIPTSPFALKTIPGHTNPFYRCYFKVHLPTHIHTQPPLSISTQT